MNINEKSTVPLPWLGGILIAMVGSISWLTTIHVQLANSAQKVQELEIKQTTQSDKLTEIQSEVKIIGHDVKRILKKMGEE